MPELPEVETIVRTLRPHLLGSVVADVALHRPDILLPRDADLVAGITGRSFTHVERRAKRILFTLDNGTRFYIHLGMTGRLTVDSASMPLPTHTHLVIRLTQCFRGGDAPVPLELRFRDPRRFGGIWWLGMQAHDDTRLGPEPLKIRLPQLARRLARTRRAIKTALLDQAIIAGLGNIYADEALHAARIDPRLPANQLDPRQVASLCRAIKLTLRRAIRHRGSTLRDYVSADGSRGAFQKLHRVYDRADEPCRTCGSPIQRIVLGGRSTHFCSECQAVDQSGQRPRPARRTRH